MVERLSTPERPITPFQPSAPRRRTRSVSFLVNDEIVQPIPIRYLKDITNSIEFNLK